MGKGSKFVGYIRVSTDVQGGNGAGLEVQRAAIHTECEHRGWNLLRIEEDVLTGKHLRRPGLQRALASARQGEADGIIVAKLDRLSRSLQDFANLLAQAQKEEWNLVALDLGVDLSTPHGEFLASVMASAAQWERRIISQRTKDALEVKKRQGVRLGRPASIEPKLSKQIRRMRYQRGYTLQHICDVLNEKAVPTPQGGSEWRPTSLRAVLRK
jgi:DNA invertase Pin-like site-specific DNA recombinase